MRNDICYFFFCHPKVQITVRLDFRKIAHSSINTSYSLHSLNSFHLRLSIDNFIHLLSSNNLIIFSLFFLSSFFFLLLSSSDSLQFAFSSTNFKRQLAPNGDSTAVRLSTGARIVRTRRKTFDFDFILRNAHTDNCVILSRV